MSLTAFIRMDYSTNRKNAFYLCQYLLGYQYLLTNPICEFYLVQLSHCHSN